MPLQIQKHRLIECIRIQAGEACLLPYHQDRINRSLDYIGAKRHISLEEYVASLMEEEQFDGECYKLRFEYDSITTYAPTITLYTPQQLNTLTVVDILDCQMYSYKWAERGLFEHYPKGLFRYNELLTDTAFSNIAVEFESGEIVTPLNPLLKGVMREHLLDEGLIQAGHIDLNTLREGKQVHLINAMLPLGALTLKPSAITVQ